MKIDISKIDREQFMVHTHEVAGEVAYLVQPQHIGCVWSKENAIFRSSLWSERGELISAGFKKFVNWGEKPEIFPVPDSLRKTQIIEKLDGSALIVSKYKDDLIVRTRGTVDASRLDNGHEIELLMNKYPLAFNNEMLDTGASLIFEWVSPANRIVIDYGLEPDIFLIGAIDHLDYWLHNQDCLDDLAYDYGVQRPRTFKFDSITDMLAAVEVFDGVEGVCLYHSDGQEIHKIKGAKYLALHRLKSNLNSIRSIHELYESLEKPDSVDAFIEKLPKEYDFETMTSAKALVEEFYKKREELADIVIDITLFLDLGVKSMTSRKDQAQSIMDRFKNGDEWKRSMAFNLLDQKLDLNSRLKAYIEL